MSNPAYPYIVVRIFAAIYQKEPLKILEGEPKVEIARGTSFVRHPRPYLPDGSISPECRQCLIDGVQRAVRDKRFRMCIVWGRDRCTFVERETVNESNEPPSGGLKTTPEFPFDAPTVPRASVIDDPEPDPLSKKRTLH